MTLRFKPAEFGHFPDAPIKVALIQVKFPLVPAVDDEKLLDKFVRELGDEWSVIGQGNIMEAQIQITPGPNIVSHKQSVEKVWRIEDRDKKYNVTLSRDAVGIDSVKHKKFESDFAPTFKNLLEGLTKIYKPKEASRLGVRYINEVKLGDETPLPKRISPELLSPIGSDLPGSDLLQSFNELRFQQPNGYFTLRHGMVESKYVLDYDYYVHDVGEFNVPELVQKASVFHEEIKKCFWWSLAKEYQDELRQQEVET